MPLLAAIRAITNAEINRVFGADIVQRSKEYADDIEQVFYASGKAQTAIFGTRPYDVVLETRTGQLVGRCSCPYGGACKHLAALVRHLRDEATDEDLAAMEAHPEKKAPANFDFDEWLKQRSKDELRALVQQFAPAAFRQSLALQQVNPEARTKVFDNADKSVRELVKKIGRYTIHDFESDLMTRLEPLRPLWRMHTEAMVKLLLWLLKAIDKAQDGEFMYSDYDEEGFTGQKLGSYLAQFTAALPDTDTAMFFQKISDSFGEQNYTSCDNYLNEILPLLSLGQYTALKPLFLDKNTLNHYTSSDRQLIWAEIKPLLSAQEQKTFLSHQSDEFFLLELARLYEQEGQIKEALGVLDKALVTSSNKPSFGLYYNSSLSKIALFEQRIIWEAQYQKGKKLSHWTSRYVSDIASAASLQFAVKYLPEEKTTLESLLQHTNISAYSDYLEKAERLDEVLALFKKYDNKLNLDHQYLFFKRHKQQFPKEALAVFRKRLDLFLPEAKDRAYSEVTAALLELQAVMPPEQFKTLLQTIKSSYSRRSNLLSMLKRSGL